MTDTSLTRVASFVAINEMAAGLQGCSVGYLNELLFESTQKTGNIIGANNERFTLGLDPFFVEDMAIL